MNTTGMLSPDIESVGPSRSTPMSPSGEQNPFNLDKYDHARTNMLSSATQLSAGSDFPRSTVFLRPIANPNALGLAAWGSAAFVLSSYLAEWYGTDATAVSIWPFLLTFGGLGQLAAGMWSFNARDTFATVFHSIWGAFWFALGLYYAILTTGLVPLPTGGTRWGHLQNFAIWQVPLACMTAICSLAAYRRDMAQLVTYLFITVGSILIIIGWFTTTERIIKSAAYFWIFAALGAYYRVFVYLAEEAMHFRKELPVYRIRGVDARPPVAAAANEWGGHGWNAGMREPGVVRGDW
ncbi:hypothetical protein HK097_005943 [Rhizophlyctis rosea]|uniref:Uncharacterized protein n=1 Tax=Rhizophlyctis rosea TaxID=64517 RepID=A0AAD5SKX8_9FUNG|nr:hypothetical protein HK097_005943 [Rhizophlyctis rosea]